MGMELMCAGHRHKGFPCFGQFSVVYDVGAYFDVPFSVWLMTLVKEVFYFFASPF